MRSVLAVLTCRKCGSDLQQEAPAQVTEVLGFLPMQCVKPGCRRHYALKVELLSCPGNPKVDKPVDGRTLRYQKDVA